jgi:hypothetical protein
LTIFRGECNSILPQTPFVKLNTPPPSGGGVFNSVLYSFQILKSNLTMVENNQGEPGNVFVAVELEKGS